MVPEINFLSFTLTLTMDYEKEMHTNRFSISFYCFLRQEIEFSI